MAYHYYIVHQPKNCRRACAWAIENYCIDFLNSNYICNYKITIDLHNYICAFVNNSSYQTNVYNYTVMQVNYNQISMNPFKLSSILSPKLINNSVVNLTQAMRVATFWSHILPHMISYHIFFVF